jgi:hypothetical protein
VPNTIALPFPDHVPLRSGVASCARADVAAAPTSANAKTRYLIASSRADAIAHAIGLAGALGFEPRLTESELDNYPSGGRSVDLGNVVVGSSLHSPDCERGRSRTHTTVIATSPLYGVPIRPKCDCGHRFSFSSSLGLATATSDLRPGGGHGTETR